MNNVLADYAMRELTAEISRLRKENERLKEGGCRFDCRADRKKDFVAGYSAGLEQTWVNHGGANAAWEQYRRNK